MKNLELQEYAEAVIVAFERKKPIKAKLLKVWQLKIVLGIVKDYLEQKKNGLPLEVFLKSEKLEIEATA